MLPGCVLFSLTVRFGTEPNGSANSRALWLAGRVEAGGHITVENSSPRVQNVRVGSSAAGQPETEPYKGVFLMGDKGGKKDKKKVQDQKNKKQKIKDKKKKDKEPKRLT